MPDLESPTHVSHSALLPPGVLGEVAEAVGLDQQVCQLDEILLFPPDPPITPSSLY